MPWSHTWPSARVAGGVGGVAAPAGGGPGHVAGPVLRKCPAGGLFCLVVGAAQGCETALAGPAAEVVRDGVIEVAAGGGPPAAREHTGRLADPDEMLQQERRPVGVGFPLVGAGPRLQVNDGHRRDPPDVIGRPGPGTWPGTGPRPGAGAWTWPGTGTWPGAGIRLGTGRPAWRGTVLCAAVGNCPPGWVCEGEAPLGGGVAGEQVGDGAGVVCVDGPEPGHLAR